ncbi:hypothetical protein ZWY2020_009889 [Hordeum vulgare]|nr:hypothetical protein ZWY2020_009889 [Hordeum vulgare]
MTASSSSSFCRLDYRAFISSTNIAAAGRRIRFQGHLLVTQSEAYLNLPSEGFSLCSPDYSHSPRFSRSSLRTPSLLIPLLPCGSAASTMTKGQTSKLESQKKKKKAAAPAHRRQRALPAGWIQGDFLPSTLTTDDLLELVEQGMIANKSWRLPAEGETEPAPQDRERVLLLSHVYRGFSLPPDPFFRGITNHFGAQLHHFPRNAIAHLSAFVVLCECFIGCPPHWGLFKYIFSARSQTVKKLSQLDDKTHILQLCGGLGFQKKSKSSYPALQLSESVKNRQ